MKNKFNKRYKKENEIEGKTENKITRNSKIKNKIFIIVCLLFIVLFFKNVQAEEINMQSAVEEIGESYGLNSYMNEIQNCINEYKIDDYSINDIKTKLLSGSGIDYKNLLTIIVSSFFKEINSSLKGGIIILIIIVIMAILSGVSLEKNSEIIDITYLVCFVTIAVIITITFKDVIVIFRNTTDILSKIMQIESPFLIAILIGTGGITTTGLVQPLLLFISSLIGYIVTYVVIPFITVSVVLNIISAMSDNLKFSDMSKFFNKCVIWIVGICLTLFLGILSLETTLSSSIDSLTVDVAGSAMSNFIPVVGKFFSDSLETVVGATKIIGKTGGIVGIITILIISFEPLLKIIGVMIIYTIISMISSVLSTNEKITKFISSFTEVYKTLIGVLIGIDILFVISVGIILNLCSKIVT